MKLIKTIIYSVLLSFLIFSCNSDDTEEVQDNPCDSTAQGFSANLPTVGSFRNSDSTISANSINSNFLIDDAAITVHLVTGNPQGDYYHIFNNNGPTLTNFYTFAVNSGDTSTLDQNWNTTAGSFLSVDNVPFYGSQQSPIVLTTVQGGSQVGDRIFIEFLEINGSIEGQYCVDIDEVISAEDYVYVTDGTDFKIINVFDPNLPFVENTIPANTAYFVEVIDNRAYLGYFDAIQPFMTVYNVTDPNNLTSIQSYTKGGQFGRLTDIEKIGDFIYISDEFTGAHHLNTNNGSVFSFENHDIMSFSLINNRLACLGSWGSLYGFDVANPINPINLNYIINPITDLDSASYPHTNGSFHSWVRNNGVDHFVANIADAKLKKVEEQPFNYAVVSEVDLSGYATAFAIADNYGFITTRASALAPLQTSFDGVTMVNLNVMTIADSQTLSNASGVAVKANIAYVTDANGLHIYDVSQGDLSLINSYAPGFGNYISINN